MREIQAVPPAAGAMKRTFAVERAISGAQGDLSVLVREAEANGGSISIQGGKGVVTALVSGRPWGTPVGEQMGQGAAGHGMGRSQCLHGPACFYFDKLCCRLCDHNAKACLV